jgi:endonuclease G, mitochondrial
VKTRAILLALILVCLSSLALAAPSQCPQHYFEGQAPDILNEKLAQKTQEICYQKYGIIHSGIARTALVSGEHLTQEELTKPHAKRKDKFHPDLNLPPAERAELKDYEHSGYDRGHMSPVGDMADSNAQQESFSLANMIPQDHDLNTKLWEGVEVATRNLAKTSGELYVITGPIFLGSNLKRLNGRVLIPTYVYKAIYDPQQKQAAAYFVANSPGGHYAVVSVAEVEQLAGVSLFPALADEVKQSPMALPAPKPTTHVKVIKDQAIVPEKPAP